MLVDQLEPADVAALVADAFHQSDRVGAELLEVSVLFFAAGTRGTIAVVMTFRFSSFRTQLLTLCGAVANGASG